MYSESDPGPHPLHPSQAEMAEALPQIVWTARPDGAVDWVNQEFEVYTGLRDADLAAGDWLHAVHPDDRDPTLKFWGEAVARAQPYRTEFRLWCAARDQWRWHLIDARPHRDAAGTITRWYGMAIDVQALRDAQQTRETELRLQIVERCVLEHIAAGESLQRVLQHICDAMTDMVTGSTTTIATVAEDGLQFERRLCAASMDLWSRAMGRTPIGEGHGSCGTAVFRREPVFSADIANDPLWTQPCRELAARHGLAACWSMPVLDSTGKPLACISCYLSVSGAPTKTQITLLHRMARTVMSTIEAVGNRDRLQTSERRYRSLFDFLPIAIWEEDISGILRMLDALKACGVTDFEAWLDSHPTFAIDALAEIRVIDANRAALQLHGVKGAGLETMSRALFSLANDPRYRLALRGMLVAAWEGRTELETSYSIPRSDGTKVDVLVRLLLPEPGSGRLLVTELDVTEHRRVEERFRHVAQTSSDFIFDRDLISEITWVNDVAAWHPDYPPGAHKVPRQLWVDSIHPDDDLEILSQIENAIDSGQSFWEGEYRLRLHDGTYIPVLERASILRNDNAEPVRMIGNIIDLSEQKALQAQLRQSQRLDAVGQLTGGIAHDFNNLLTVILGYAEILADTLPRNQPAETMARQIMIASERAADLTDRLLAFARKQPLSPGAFDANAIVEGMRMMVERALTSAITLDLALADDLRAVHVDQAMFESALLNLCVNARDAMPEGGTIRIKTSAITLPESTDPDMQLVGEYVRIAVSDNGEGMTEDALARAFEPFFTTKPVGAGSGLGLSMVHGFAHQSGGQVHIYSELGTGTTVELLLPCHKHPVTLQGEPQDESAAS